MLLDGLAASDAEAAKAAAIAVRQRVKDADARQRRSYLAEAEKFLEKQSSAGGSAGAIAAGVKILGYLEDEKAIPTLLEFTKRQGQRARPCARRRSSRCGSCSARRARTRRKVVGALVDAAEDADRALAQTALHTLAGVDLPDEAMKRLEKLVAHPDVERARFVMEMLGRHEGAESGAGARQGAGDDEGQAAGARSPPSCLVRAGRERGAGGRRDEPVREEAVAPLAKALLETDDADRAWLLRQRAQAEREEASRRRRASRCSRCRPSVSRRATATGSRCWRSCGTRMRERPRRPCGPSPRSSAGATPTRRSPCCGSSAATRAATDEDRYALAAAELARGTARHASGGAGRRRVAAPPRGSARSRLRRRRASSGKTSRSSWITSTTWASTSAKRATRSARSC